MGAQTESLLGTLADERFALLVNLGRKITDFQMGGASAADAAADARQLKDADEIDDTYGVNVQFEDSEDEENDNELMDDAEGDGSADEDEGGVEANFDATLKTQGMKEEDDDKAGQLHARDVDAYWLQRSLNKFIDDPVQAQRKAKEIIDILQVSVVYRGSALHSQPAGFDPASLFDLLHVYNSAISLFAECQRRS